MISKRLWIIKIELMIYINCMIPIKAQCLAQDRASLAPFSNLTIVKIIILIHPKLLKKESFQEEANYFKVINKKI